jgi:hypothetical protein
LFTIPSAFFGRNKETVIGSIYNVGTRTRPIGTFGEPSFFALYMFFLGTIIIELNKLRKIKYFYLQILLIISTLVLIGSGLGLIGVIALFFISRNKFRTLTVASVITLFLIIFFYFQNSLSIILGISFSTSSWQNRVGDSLKYIYPYLQTYPFGYPPRRLFGIDSLQIGDASTGVFLNNGMVYWLFAYGFGGLLILFTLIMVMSTVNRSFFVLVIFLMNQNGSFLDFDKISLLIIATILMRLKFDNVTIENNYKVLETSYDDSV